MNPAQLSNQDKLDSARFGNLISRYGLWTRRIIDHSYSAGNDVLGFSERWKYYISAAIKR